MYFTREPVIETVITSREGYKLSVRNTKHLSQDPFIVEAVEVICLGSTSFFRNCDHSKPFVVPAGDYEIMEVRDAKINLKAVGLDRGVKIAGGREALLKLSPVISDKEPDPVEETEETLSVPVQASSHSVVKKEKKKDFSKNEKWKEKKKQSRRKKDLADAVHSSLEIMDVVQDELDSSSQICEEEDIVEEKKFVLLPPPPKLISEVMSSSVNEDLIHEEHILAESSDAVFTSADLDESLHSLMNESKEVIESLLTDDETLPVFFEDQEK